MVFENLHKYQQNLEEFTGNFEQIMNEIVTELAPLMNEMNTENMSFGFRSDGKKIGTYHPTSSYEANEDAGIPYYIDFKSKLSSKPSYGKVDLILTGETASLISYELEDNEIFATSKGALTEKLIRQYGSDKWIGINDNQKRYISEQIENKLIEIIKERYKLI